MATKHDKVVTHHEGFPPTNLHNPVQERSRDRLKTLHLHYRNAYGHKIYQSDDILQEAPTHKFAWSVNKMVMWGHVAN